MATNTTKMTRKLYVDFKREIEKMLAKNKNFKPFKKLEKNHRNYLVWQKVLY